MSPPLRIAINALSAVSGGGTTYFEGLLPALALADPDNHYFLLRAPWQEYLPPAPGANFRWIDCDFAEGSILARIAFEQSGIVRFIRREGIDVLYSPAELTTLAAPCPVVLALRNFSAYALRWQLGLAYWRRNMLLGELARLSAWKADRVVFVSDMSRRIIARKLMIPLCKTEVIPHGIHPAFRPPDTRSDRSPSSLVTRPYLLSVSQIRRNKNYPRLVEAFALLAREGVNDLDLVILGGCEDEVSVREMSETIRRTGLEGRVHLPGAIPYRDLPAWYGGARLFVFPSLIETFGHPIVEAMASGLPIVASDAPSMPEIAGDAGVFFDPRQPESIAAALRRVLGDPVLAAELSRRSLARAGAFTWRSSANRMRGVFESVAGKN